MALKVLMIRKKINEKKKLLDELGTKSEEFAKREAELEQAIEEASTDEEHKTVEEEVEAFDSEKAELEAQKKSIEEEVQELEQALEKEEAEQEATPQAQEVPEPQVEERKKEVEVMMTKDLRSQVAQNIEREDVKGWLNEIRSAIKAKRAITNVGLTIPEVYIGLLRENIMNYSKLLRHVRVVRVSGEARQIIMGTVPEAVWTECCANLNELSLGFNDITLDCHKVGGYYAVCNANLEDSDIDLAIEILTSLGQSIGLAVDKAIDYGRVTGMPLGIVTRLLQTSKPESYPATAREWVNLSETNVITIPVGTTGLELFKAIMLASGKAKGVYARGGKVWQMNETTYTNLMAEALSVTANGAIVSAVSDTMPVIGGIIEVLEFIPDNVIIGGYHELYTVAERAGNQFATSEHVRFLQDQTVYRGTARYDGTPVIPEAFVVIGLGVTPTAEMTFASDTANTEGTGA